MIETWYNTPARLALIAAVADSWMGTPFGQNGSVKGKGGGVSCQKLAAALFIESGFIEAFDVPSAPMNWAQNNKTSIIVPYMDAHSRFTIVPAGEPLVPGDVLGFRIGGCVHHMGVVIDRTQFLHVWKGAGVIKSPIKEPTYSTRLENIWRPKP